MDTREQNIQIFLDAMDWIRENQRLSDAVKRSQEETKVYYPGELPEYRYKETEKLPIQ